MLYGETLYESARARPELAAAEGLVFVHPYDDPKVMAGQGTIALEMLEDVPDLDQLVVPIGGGGLISGIAVAAKALKPGIEIDRRRGRALPLVLQRRERRGPARSAARRWPRASPSRPSGTLPLPIVRDLVSEIVLVEEAA